MKTFILSLAFFSIANFAMANDSSTASNSVWIDTNTVLISNSQNPEFARRDCEATMRILSIMSNDKVVFRSMCEPSYNPRCNYYFCYQLNAKVMVIEDRKL